MIEQLDAASLLNHSREFASDSSTSAVATQPLREPGDMLARLMFISADPKCANGC